jgi:hypothetical protein
MGIIVKYIEPNNEDKNFRFWPRKVLKGLASARVSWQHSIPPVKELRYSIMMRTLRTKP